ncbi:MAG: peptidoglycan DD-metalloendopeptidase family protein [Flavobacteriales bacterium]
MEKKLTNKTYAKGETITFPLYKKESEKLWLEVSCIGDEDEHKEAFLKKEGAYFTIGGGKCPRCGVLTIEELNQIFTNASEDRETTLMNAFNEANTKFGLNTCRKKAHFFAQVREEVGTSINISNGEGLNYSAEALPSHFSKFSTTGRLGGSPNSLAYQYGRSSRNNYIANQEMIANIAYAHRNGNGNVESGDGWNYRGKGIIQITFKNKYDRINSRIDSDYPGFGIDIDANNINNLREGTVASMAYWEEYGCQKEADKGVERSNFDAIVNIVNSATPSREARWEHLQNMIKIFKVSECQGEGEGACVEDCSQCFNYADVWENPVISSDNGGKNNNRYNHGSTRGHKGIDILSGSTYKDVHSIMCGTVEKIINSFSTNEYKSKSLGNIVNVKSKDKNGNTVYILYCHLDEIYVTEGQKVSHGTKIAKSGSTGNAAQILNSNGGLKNGIWSKNWHVHIEATANGAGLATFYGKTRLQPEDYMKTKFDNNGDAIK